jgi:phytoene desaturase
MLLAKSGVDVTVFEKDQAVGGRTKTIKVDDHLFDLGPTFFLYPQILETLFARCGLQIGDYIDLRRLEPSYCVSFENGPSVRASSDLKKLEDEIAKVDPHDARAIARFIATNRRKLGDFKPILDRPVLSLLDYLAPNVLKALHWILPFASVDEELSRYFRDPRIRLVFSFQTKYLGMSPFRCPNLFTFLSFLEHEFGVWHPMGGCGAVSAGMARAAADLGAKIRLGEAVETITFNGKQAQGVVVNGETHASDAVIVNADFADAIPKMIPAHLRKRWSDTKIESADYSCSTFMLYLGIEGRYDLDHHTIFLAETYAENIKEIERAEHPPLRPSIYVANPSRTDPAFATADGSSLYVLVPVGHCGRIDWSKEATPFRDRVIERLERLGLPGLSQRIRCERILTPDDWRDELSIYRGATFNLAHGLNQMLYFRPHNRFQDVNGVYLVGGGTHPGSGLPVIYEGARITADLVLGDFGLVPAPTAPMPVTRGEVDATQLSVETP